MNESQKKFYKSQLGQDKFVARDVFRGKRNGYFLDVGAFDGLDLSNTYALEKLFDWKGICIEPSEKFLELKKNRNCLCLRETVGAKTGDTINFVYCETDPALSGNLGTLNSYIKDTPGFEKNKVLRLKTVSLLDLLKKNNAPKYIDYFSIDTEGYEYEILKDFNFKEYKFGVITVEHNDDSQLKKNIRWLMRKNGYKKVAQVKKSEDWYVAENLYNTRIFFTGILKQIDSFIFKIRFVVNKRFPGFYSFCKKIFYNFKKTFE